MRNLKTTRTAGLIAMASVFAAPTAQASNTPAGAGPIACFFAFPSGFTGVHILDVVLFQEFSEDCPLDL